MKVGRGAATAVVWGLAAVLAIGLAVALTASDRAEALSTEMGQRMTAAAVAAGFEARVIEVQGASAESRAEIVRASGLAPGAPILDVNLATVRGRVEQVPWVSDVRVVRLLPDTLVIAVHERPRLAVWQNGGRLSVIDSEGRMIRDADPAEFSDLPLVVGSGADAAAAEVIPLLRQRPRLMNRTEALVRVDGRRWDVRLTDGTLVQLPARDLDAALIRLDQLDARSRVTELGFARIDLRDPEITSLRPRDRDERTRIAAALSTLDPALTAED